jgi:hypothetical protein
MVTKKRRFKKNFIEKLNSDIKKMDLLDIQFTKLSVAAGILFLITAWESARIALLKIHWGIYLVLMIFFALRPISKIFRCNCKD